MLDYLQLYPQTIELVKRYKEDQRCRLYEAMAFYAFTGQEPSWPDDAAEWLIWEALKQTVDRADQKVRQNRKNASRDKNTETNGSEAERIEAKPSETERTQANASETDNHKPKNINQDPESVTHETEGREDTTPPNPPAKKADSGTGFDAFWAAYPKKQDKQNALKAWKKLAPGAEIQRNIIKALQAQRASPQWQKDGGQFIPLPSTWLNGRRWEDEETPQAARVSRTVSAQMYTQRDYTEDELNSLGVDIIADIKAHRGEAATG